MPKRVLITFMIIAIGLLVFTGVLVVAAPVPFLSRLTFLQPSRTGTDPLSAAEQQQVLGGLSLQASSRTVVLLVERHQESKAVMAQGNWPRRADVYSYNYDTDTLTQAVVNLDTGAVDSMETVQNVQLPLTQVETEQAIQLALADPQVSAALQTQYQTVTGAPLTNPRDQLDFHVLIFQARAMPDQARGAAANCGLHRCAQLLVTTQNGYFIDLLPIVDLSDNRVVKVVLSSGP